MAAHAIVVLLWKAHERLPAPQREKHTDGQYERNAQEGRLVSLFSAPNLLFELARAGVAFSPRHALIAAAGVREPS